MYCISHIYLLISDSGLHTSSIALFTHSANDSLCLLLPDLRSSLFPLHRDIGSLLLLLRSGAYFNPDSFPLQRQHFPAKPPRPLISSPCFPFREPSRGLVGYTGHLHPAGVRTAAGGPKRVGNYWRKRCWMFNISRITNHSSCVWAWVMASCHTCYMAFITFRSYSF